MSSRGFARIPVEVLTDPRLNASDVRVYAALALRCRGNNIAITTGAELAAATVMSRRQVNRCLINLGARGHISRPANTTVGRFSVFQLNSQIFSRSVTPMSRNRDTHVPSILNTYRERGTARAKVVRLR